MAKTIVSTGIDIGTTTTQIIFSHIKIEDNSGFNHIPNVKIEDKKIIYKSPIYFTPLNSDTSIDGHGVADIIRHEYKKAGMTLESIDTGAVIITGESARKRNAQEVLSSLSDLAGDFVVAIAGADLESVLAGKGSGAAELSLETGQLVANIDIGGGTTNICYFKDGQVVDTACLNIGGRLIKIEDRQITYISDQLIPLIHEVSSGGVTLLQVGNKVNLAILDKLVKCMADNIGRSIGYGPASQSLEKSLANHGITCGLLPELIMFSGGVADCIDSDKEAFTYGDIGVLLGKAIGQSALVQKAKIIKAKETMNATVVGAGNYSLEVTGSTITYNSCDFPLKNLPVFSLQLENKQDLQNLLSKLRQCVMRIKDNEIKCKDTVIFFKGLEYPTYKEIESIAHAFIKTFANDNQVELPILIMESDMSKVLGQTLRRQLNPNTRLICIDSIHCQDGDYIDIGYPLANGKALPVVIKSLIFG